MTNAMATADRITKFSHGALGLNVNGVKVLVSVDNSALQGAAEALAAQIAALGPCVIEEPHHIAPDIKAPEPTRKSKRFTVGQRVWCNVTAIRSWMTVTEVGKDGRIKVDGGRVWCPLHNFDAEVPDYQKR